MRTVGVALPGVGLRLLDPAGNEVAVGEVGEIWASGPNVFDGYHGRPDETSEVLRDGWFATGDLGSFDADGYLTIAGRLKDMIIVSGFNVYPREVEDALLGHPDVAEAAVVPAPDELRLAVPKAYVVLVAGREPSKELAGDILRHCRENLAPYKRIRRLQFADLPKTISGKIRRVELRGREEQLASGEITGDGAEWRDDQFPELRG